MGGLAPTITKDEFKRYFEQFGNITDVVVMYDYISQRTKVLDSSRLILRRQWIRY